MKPLPGSRHEPTLTRARMPPPQRPRNADARLARWGAERPWEGDADDRLYYATLLALQPLPREPEGGAGEHDGTDTLRFAASAAADSDGGEAAAEAEPRLMARLHECWEAQALAETLECGAPCVPVLVCGPVRGLRAGMSLWRRVRECASGGARWRAKVGAAERAAAECGADAHRPGAPDRRACAVAMTAELLRRSLGERWITARAARALRVRRDRGWYRRSAREGR